MDSSAQVRWRHGGLWMFLSAALAIACLPGYWVLSAYRQRAAIDYYRRRDVLSGFKEHLYERNPMGFGWGGLPYPGRIPARSTPVREWIADHLGEDFVYSVDRLDLGHGDFRRDDVAPLADLPGLRYLSIKCSPLVDDDLAVVGRLPKLEYLTLERANRITDAGIAHLAGLQHLRGLRLFHAQLTEQGMRTIVGLSRLECLELWDTHLTDAGLAQLAALEHLSVLGFERRSTTDIGIQRLERALPRLKIVQFAPFQQVD